MREAHEQRASQSGRETQTLRANYSREAIQMKNAECVPEFECQWMSFVPRTRLHVVGRTLRYYARQARHDWRRCWKLCREQLRQSPQDYYADKFQEALNPDVEWWDM